MRPFDHIFLSCEHATCHIPRQYRYLFTHNPGVLKTHLGYDIGIAPVADRLAKQLRCPLIEFPLSRLLIEPNRSQRCRLFSTYSRKLSESEKAHLIQTYYQPYRESLHDHVVSGLETAKTVLHVSLHSFTPVLNRKKRNADVGLLYDTSRQREISLAQQIQEQLVNRFGLRVRRNYPYLGVADGIVTWLRRQFGPKVYIGLEIEMNQAWLLNQSHQVRAVCTGLSHILTLERSDKKRT